MSQTIALTRKTSFYERAIIGLFSKLPKGRLEMTLPSGEQLVFGDGTGGIQADIRITDNSFFKRCVLYGDIGFGEAYTDGEWETSSITNVISWFLLNVEYAPVSGGTQLAVLNVLKFFNRISHWRRANDKDGARKNISEHYDLNNAFFALWLDPSMTYSSAYFENESYTLAEAQTAKYERLCRQMRLQPGMHVLEIGSGWGANAIHIASHYACKVTTVTISEEQHKLATERVKAAGLEDKVTVLLSDYRDVTGTFDRIVSVEMLEAVGDEFLDVFFAQCTKLLAKDGLLAMQVITCPDSRYESLRTGVDWIQKHIFPGSLLPSVGRMNQAINKAGDLTLVDIKDLGRHYARTLAEWRKTFNAQREGVMQLGFDDRFMRKWNYYFSYCEAAFAMRNINVMQLLYTRPNNLNW